MKRIGILGSTGSIGRQTLELVDAFPEQFVVTAIAAHSSTLMVADQINRYSPPFVAMTDVTAGEELAQYAGRDVIRGPSALVDIVDAAEVDMWVVAVVGTASLSATMAIIQKKIPIALACKEVLVSAGEIIMDAARRNHVPIIPVDSEHAALKQCLASVNENNQVVHQLILTASGGPFLHRKAETFHSITPDVALKHPKWTMGAKISIDSSTLMNKGLEVIEAHHLFGMPYSAIDVVIHPESIVHSMIELVDGTFLAQLGLPDMRSPIQYALSFPEKWATPYARMSIFSLSSLHFMPPDRERFPMLQMAYDCGAAGKTSAAVMNAANEAAVGLFLDKKIGYTDIASIVQNTVTSFDHFDPHSIEEIVQVDHDIKDRLRIHFG